MVDERDPVAYVVLGSYVHPECVESSRLMRKPVRTDELPSSVFCAVCDDRILTEPCVFCEIIAGREPVEWILSPETWKDAVAFVPLDPVTEGHCLIVSKRHVRDFAEDPSVFGQTAMRAAELMQWTDRPMNVITSRGREATQSIFHLHLHLVPRAEGDGLPLPWHSGKRKK